MQIAGAEEKQTQGYGGGGLTDPRDVEFEGGGRKKGVQVKTQQFVGISVLGTDSKN